MVTQRTNQDRVKLHLTFTKPIGPATLSIDCPIPGATSSWLSGIYIL